MTPRRQLPTGPSVTPQAAPLPLAFSPMEFAPPPVMEQDASGAQAIGGLVNMAGALASRIGGGGGGGEIGAAMKGMMGGATGPTDAPMRRKTPMAMMPPNYA